jgi:hypothetical protein
MGRADVESQEGSCARMSRLTGAFLGFAIGLVLWVSSPLLVGKTEPWDAEWPYYTSVMLVAGAALGAAWPTRWMSIYFGLWAGQIVALLLPPHDRAWALLGVFTTGLGSVLGLTGVLCGALARRAWQRIARSHRKKK